ncbi:hypothetical protein SAMN04489761_0181 [Tenacibaculum sp. MAR_2009_124]|uniref:hypothetical protein n=1 Tax=Tenacibaculum sp. MAR_2009_124 TaxID=1250059 RepID=UPI0008979AAD|nr:hypothetical protein [Tenacibaculum sp. MAR_2009_124]SEB36672.1 hypothetical protein SAMN04489761_0181 [Tenacibaculum sp. MAR_2009_124]
MKFWLNILLKVLLFVFILFTIYGHVWLLFLSMVSDDSNLLRDSNPYLSLFASLLFLVLSTLYLKELFLGYYYKSREKSIKSTVLIVVLMIPYFIGHADFITITMNNISLEPTIILIFTIMAPIALLIHRVLALKENK